MARALSVVRQLLGAKQEEMSNIFDGFQGDDFSQMDKDEFKRAEGLDEELAALEKELKEATDQDNRARAMRDSARARQMPAPQGRGSDGSQGNRDSTIITPDGERKTIGQLFAESVEYKSWLDGVKFGDTIPDSVKGFRTPPVQFKDLITGVSDTSAGALIESMRLPGFMDLPMRPLVLRDIITVGQTGTDTIEYVQMNSMTNNAATVPEAQSSAVIGDGTGGTTTAVLGGRKPESAFTFVKLITTVKTIAHWIPATKRALADASQLRTLIDAFLRSGLEQELEDQIAAGDGVGENFLGLENISGVTAQAWDTDILVTTRKARTKVRLVGRATPSAYVLHPLDWEKIQLIRENGATGPFMFGGPAGVAAPRLWALPVVESEAITQGTGWVADWRLAVLWDRQQANITASDSHADFFVRNLVAVLGEMRAAFGILRPPAFVEMDLVA